MTEQPNEAAQTEDFEFESLRLAENYRRALVQEFTDELRGRVLEVGSGIGQMTALLRELPAVELLQCVEPSADFCAEFSREHPTIPLVQGTAADVPCDTDWNAIISINVLEHIRDHELELAQYRQLLTKKKGRLCLFVPARPEIYAPIDRDFGHHRRYTHANLKAALTAAGFEIVRLEYFNSLGYLAWWFTFCFLKRRHFHPKSVLLYDRVIFPVVHFLEHSVVRPPLGQSLLAVAQAR